MKAKLLLTAMAMSLVLSACGDNGGNSGNAGNGGNGSQASGNDGQAANAGNEATGDDLAYGKSAEPVTLSIGFKIPDDKLKNGDTNENNIVSRYFESLTNVKVVHAWEAKGDDAFKQKVNLAIASNDLPDAMVVDRNQLRKLIDNDMLEDLTDTYEKYGSQLVKDLYASTNGMALADATSDDKLYGLPNVAIEADAPSLLWVRQDWLDKLKLSPPKTMDDLEKIAKAFVEQDPDGNGKADTVGLEGDKSVVYGQKPNPNGFDAIFGAFHAFPKNWIKDASGNVVYGSIAPENKEALAKLADWYKNGLIDKQFALYKETQEPIVANKTGLFFGPWWMPYWPLADSVTNDTKAEWKAYAAPLDADGKFTTHMAPVTDRYVVVRKGYEHPEAAIKMLNVFTRYERRQDPNTEEAKKLDDYAAETGVHIRNFYPFDLLLDYSDAVVKRYNDVQKAVKGEVDPSTFDPDTKLVYDFTMAEKENPKKNMDAWKPAKAYEIGGAVLATQPMEKVYSVFYGMTRTMETKWATLEKLESETFLKIIVGDLPVSAFDDFVAQWKKLGGDQITKEVTDIVNDK
ncbi:putative aldouronate transport system substrate-binding protein [Paenibacillus sp. UNC496MF]|uniref:extracellular solute-binding protein n=1 Tax=Paenibacillus sp. UNC496MF TaxID=1502753 RepID=UPI0008E4C0DF|nr:extracellular solute-binding protein [Paenibacillus sp. UNC496MF]SFJ22300.1 putative aldouronate transport system substrate-binding protein [Paenibacillus sp. UNC496MF]